MNILQTVSQAYSCWLWTNITEEVRRYEHLYNPSLNTYKDVPHFICLKQQQYCQISCHSAITWPRFHGNVPKAHFSDSPLFRNCEYSNVNHYCPHAHPNESHNHKHINAFISQALTWIQNIIIHTCICIAMIQKYLYDCQRMHALSVLDKICVMSCDNLPVISFAWVVAYPIFKTRVG